MGMAASQTRLLALQNREVNASYFASQINKEKLALTRQQDETQYEAKKDVVIKDEAVISVEAQELAKQEAEISSVQQNITGIQAKALAAYKVFAS